MFDVGELHLQAVGAAAAVAEVHLPQPFGIECRPLEASLDGFFRVRAPETTPGGFYEATLEIQYDGDLDLKDNFYTLPITVVAPRPSGDETALLIFQETIPETAPGKSASFNLRYLSPTG
ncbi:hypothetical protein [Streptomyces sp. PU_AKi4]|uniref:hypothetical protein n=1 Tax=unclassified Streptomyces TaxID=2593676 RepID=UPI0015C47E06